MLVSALVLPPVIPTGSVTLSAPTPGTYQVDPGHSSVLFRIQHLGVANFYGRFNEVSGSFTWAENAADSQVQIEVSAESVDSNSEGRDRHIKSADFFNAKQHPKMTFASKKVVEVEEGLLRVTGDLTFAGKTKSIDVMVEPIGSGDRGERFGYRAGLDAAFSFKRSDFGVNSYIDQGMLGDDIKILVSLEAQKQ